MDTRRTNLPMVLALSLTILGFLIGTTGMGYSANKPIIYTATWNSTNSVLKVVGQYWGNGQSVIVSIPATGDVLGTVQSDKKGNWTLKVSNPLIVPCLIWAESAQSFAQKKVQNAPAVCSGSPGTLAFGFNNLGMHCYDSDYSVFSILPPFNTVNAQVVRRGTGGNKPVILDPTQADLYYRAVKDEKGSINKTSKDKTNFWDYVQQLFGVTLPVDEGLTGNKMPGSGNFPQPFLVFDPGMKWFSASGIPITNWDSNNKRNTYPLMQIQPFDLSTVATPPVTYVVLPVSDEMHCGDCHATGGVAANDATKTSYGISAWSSSADPTIQYRENILILHDSKHQGYDLMGRKPVLCASCHYSPALDLAGSGPQGDQVGKPMLSYAVHGRHGKTLGGDIPGPGNPAVIPDTGISTCYECHPGKSTKCLRGVMSSAGIFCQDCHGGMLAVGGVYSSRTPWVNEPKCQSCHTGDAIDHLGNKFQFHIAYDPSDLAATPRVATNKRFAEEDGKLYRDSVGHGGIACEACHGSTHAEWPVANSPNDNAAAKQLQGHTGPIIECKTCHADGLALTTNGPHSLHNVNTPAWNLNHDIFYELDIANCKACHGLLLEGTVLSRAAANRSLYADDNRPISIPKGTQISCTLCHENPLSNSD